jgi:hypothetical protein
MIEHLSYSSISAFLDCPEIWRRKYLAKEPTMTSPALVFGSAFHGTLEKIVVDRQLKILDVWSEQWTKALEGQNVFWGTDTPEGICNEGIRLFSHDSVLRAVAQIKPAADENGAKIERRVELRVPGVPVPVIGYIDITLEDGTPADFKTSSKSWSDAKASDSLQSLFYLAALNQAGEKINWKFQHIVFVKSKKPKVQFLEHSHTPGELFFLFDLIGRVWKSIETGVFPLNPTGWKCSPSYCDFWQNCRGKFIYGGNHHGNHYG